MAKTDRSLLSLLVQLVRWFFPPPAWRLPVVLLIAVFAGLGAAVVHMARAPSYLSDRPETCLNCHVMRPAYATWRASAHGRDTTCNDCHVPHDSVLRKFAFKATDGLRHSWVFTWRLEPQTLQIRAAGRQVVQENCVRCHQSRVTPIAVRGGRSMNSLTTGGRVCWDCHRETPHGRAVSLAMTPNARLPGLPPLLPVSREPGPVRKPMSTRR